MPATRRKSGNTTSAARSQQPLSFHARSNKITKPSIPAASKTLEKATTKKLADAAEIASPSPAAEDVDVQIQEQPTNAELAIRSQAEAEKRERTDVEARAAKVTDAQVKRYWKKKEEERKAPRGGFYSLMRCAKIKCYFDRALALFLNQALTAPTSPVHQQGLSVEEKLLREFDLSSQFGPCVGIARTKRWKRADALGLNPPLEVLAVLLKAGSKPSPAVQAQRAYVDELMASKFVTS
ncbi:hypothetical protein MMC34_003408 [Xylographa carneopallida]|nr:hypothetical protein [Xylographa carneopallida]